MKDGNWVPLSKALIKSLPRDREYSRIEAAFSLQVDIDCKRRASVSGYSKLWGWSRKKVRTFLDSMGGQITYPSGKMSPIGGQVGLQARDKLGTSSGQARPINNKYLQPKGYKLGTSWGQAGDKLGNTTKDTNTKPNTKPNTKHKTERQKIVDIRPSYFSVAEWNELYSHRQKKKAAQTVRAYTTLVGEFNKAERAGVTANEILNAMSSGKGWAGFKFEWIRGNDKHKANSRKPNTLDEFNDMMENLSGNSENREIEAGNSVATIGALILPLPE